uniref:Dehydrogenase/reductase SDR family member 1 n=1 Tax=Steinernema glaseri TaxID=37863 RepID=A0A1I8A0G7_9BILA
MFVVVVDFAAERGKERPLQIPASVLQNKMASLATLSRFFPKSTFAAITGASAKIQSRHLSMSSRLFDRDIPRRLEGQVALVTGASRGIGRGIALQLGEAGATVYITGRKPSDSYSAQRDGLPSLEKTAKDIRDRGGEAIFVYCDHSKDEEVQQLFERISRDTERTLDILVNNAFSGIVSIERAAGKKFFECDPSMWDDINNVGLRNAYICATYAAKMMVPRRSGLIVNISSAGGLQYFFNVAYGVGKCAMDRMAVDMAQDMKNCGVTCVSLWPGMAKTELGIQMVKAGVLPRATGMKQSLLEKSILRGETPEFVGRAVVALANDRNAIKKTGRILITSDLASEYGFTDIDGSTPMNMRNVNATLEFFGWPTLASYVPDFVKVPMWALHFGSYKF